jgi:uncharacterized protein (DUF885 family)
MCARTISSKADFESLIKRIKAFPQQADQMIDGFREGIRAKITHPATSVATLIKQCENQIKASPQVQPRFVVCVHACLLTL